MRRFLSVLIFSFCLCLVACNTQPLPAASTQPEQAAPVQTAPVHFPPVTTLPMPIPPVSSGGFDVPEQSRGNVTATTAARPASGGPCNAEATLQPDYSVLVMPLHCAGDSAVTITVREASGRETPQLVGPQYLRLLQRTQSDQQRGVPPTFHVLLGDQIIF